MLVPTPSHRIILCKILLSLTDIFSWKSFIASYHMLQDHLSHTVTARNHSHPQTYPSLHNSQAPWPPGPPTLFCNYIRNFSSSPDYFSYTLHNLTFMVIPLVKGCNNLSLVPIQFKSSDVDSSFNKANTHLSSKYTQSNSWYALDVLTSQGL